MPVSKKLRSCVCSGVCRTAHMHFLMKAPRMHDAASRGLRSSSHYQMRTCFFMETAAPGPGVKLAEAANQSLHPGLVFAPVQCVHDPRYV